tara:strand:+ start:287 stop:667 length:381 start_codon:yes stop_codon:yes gene_type:complete
MLIKHFNIGTLTTGLQEVAKAGSRETIIIDSIWIGNLTTNNRTWSMMHLKVDESQADGFYIIKDLQVKASKADVYETPIYLLPGDSLLFSADAVSAVNIWAYGRCNTSLPFELPTTTRPDPFGRMY